MSVLSIKMLSKDELKEIIVNRTFPKSIHRSESTKKIFSLYVTNYQFQKKKL